jgi:hypothetical protein
MVNEIPELGLMNDVRNEDPRSRLRIPGPTLLMMNDVQNEDHLRVQATIYNVLHVVRNLQT